MGNHFNDSQEIMKYDSFILVPDLASVLNFSFPFDPGQV